MNEVNVDAATAAHEAFDASPDDTTYAALKTAENLLTHEEFTAYSINYTNRVVRLKADKANEQPAPATPPTA